MATVFNTNGQHASDIRVLEDACREWLGGFPWTFWVTLTFREHPTRPQKAGVHPDYAIRRLHRYLRDLERRSQGPVRYVWAHELGRDDGRLHLHALLMDCERLSARDVESAWQDGHARVSQYDKNRGAVSYIAEKIASGRRGTGWDFRLPTPAKS